MNSSEYSRWDGTQEFSPQSADKLFDQIGEYLLDHGEHLLQNLEDWEDEHPEVIEMLIKRGLVEKDETGRFHVTP
ncbi:MAG: VWA domain-containing protein, partial [Planctomycetota bacterium]|nr:VWA domain-containing protein [Planctomycetota bacterium]